MRITDFNATKRGRIAVYVDGEFLRSVHPDVFAASGLVVGSEIDADELEQFCAEAELKKAKEKALSLLSYKEYTSRQLRERLEQKVDPEAAELAVERMSELGLVNDGDYAVRLAAELHGHKRYGPLRIRQELSRRGISREHTEYALSLLDDDDDENIRAVIGKKYPDAEWDEAVRRRAYGALLRLGYRSSDVSRALRELSDHGFDD